MLQNNSSRHNVLNIEQPEPDENESKIRNYFDEQQKFIDDNKGKLSDFDLKTIYQYNTFLKPASENKLFGLVGKKVELEDVNDIVNIKERDPEEWGKKMYDMEDKLELASKNNYFLKQMLSSATFSATDKGIKDKDITSEMNTTDAEKTGYGIAGSLAGTLFSLSVLSGVNKAVGINSSIENAFLNAFRKSQEIALKTAHTAKTGFLFGEHTFLNEGLVPVIKGEDVDWAKTAENTGKSALLGSFLGAYPLLNIYGSKLEKAIAVPALSAVTLYIDYASKENKTDDDNMALLLIPLMAIIKNKNLGKGAKKTAVKETISKINELKPINNAEITRFNYNKNLLINMLAKDDLTTKDIIEKTRGKLDSHKKLYEYYNKLNEIKISPDDEWRDEYFPQDLNLRDELEDFSAPVTTKKAKENLEKITKNPSPAGYQHDLNNINAGTYGYKQIAIGEELDKLKEIMGQRKTVTSIPDEIKSLKNKMKFIINYYRFDGPIEVFYKAYNQEPVLIDMNDSPAIKNNPEIMEEIDNFNKAVMLYRKNAEQDLKMSFMRKDPEERETQGYIDYDKLEKYQQVFEKMKEVFNSYTQKDLIEYKDVYDGNNPEINKKIDEINRLTKAHFKKILDWDGTKKPNYVVLSPNTLLNSTPRENILYSQIEDMMWEDGKKRPRKSFGDLLSEKVLPDWNYLDEHSSRITGDVNASRWLHETKSDNWFRTIGSQEPIERGLDVIANWGNKTQADLFEDRMFHHFNKKYDVIDASFADKERFINLIASKVAKSVKDKNTEYTAKKIFNDFEKHMREIENVDEMSESQKRREFYNFINNRIKEIRLQSRNK